MDMLVLVVVASLTLFVTFIAFAKRYKRCPSDRILVVYGKIAGSGQGGMSAACYHGGAAFIWPLIQDYAFLELTPLAIDIKLEGALSLQNIRVNTPSTFTVGISTEPGVMENAAERLLGMEMKQVAELARDIIFGQMRVVMATMPIEAINADRDKLIENISQGVEVELKKVGLRLINVNIQDITDESGYIDALGKEAAAHAINEARVKVAEKERDGAIGAANAERDRRIRVAEAGATAVEGENLSSIKVAQSNASRREQEAEAERLAAAAEKVKSAQALAEAYQAEELAERQRAKREEAAQAADIVVPAEIEKRKIETLAEAEAERMRRTKKGEADGLRSMMEAEAAGVAAILSRKAEGFDRMVAAAQGLPELAALLLVTEQLPKLVEEQVKAISNLKIDKITVWEGGRGGNGGRTATADFLSGLVGSLPPLHELTRNVGIKLPEYLGRMEREDDRGNTPPVPPAAGGGPSAHDPGRQLGAREREDEDERGAAPEKNPGSRPKPESEPGRGTERQAGSSAADRRSGGAEGGRSQAEERQAGAQSGRGHGAGAAAGASAVAGQAPAVAREALARVRARLAARPEIFAQLDANQDGRLTRDELESAVSAAFDWGRRAASERAMDWYYTAEGKAAGPTSWDRLRHLAAKDPDLLVNRDRAPFWLPFGAVAEAAGGGEGSGKPS